MTVKHQAHPMLPDYSPFTPGSPVPIELFTGREEELKRLRDHLSASSKGVLRVAFLSGERGIGKSSLGLYIKSYAERHHTMAAVQVMLGGAETVSEMVRRVFDAALEECVSKKWSDKVKALFGKSIQSTDLFGVKLQFLPDQQQLEGLTRNFAPALRNLIKQLQDDKKAAGLLLILDNINGLAESKEFADWFKSLVDNIAVNHPMPICIVLVGVEERRLSLARLNPSLARVFDLMDIKPWNEDETKEFFNEAFGSVGHQISPDAIGLIARYAGGMPAVAHEIGDAIFKANRDKLVDRHDAIRGIVSAASIIGKKHIQEQVVDTVRSEKYRAILRKIVEASDLNDLRIERKALLAMLPESENQIVSNFIQRMKKLGVLVDDNERERGCYRFSSHILLVYFFLVYGPEANQLS